jgi:exopolysaccharide biosynthesis protein
VEIREAGNAPIAAGTFVLAMGMAESKRAPKLDKGAVVKISAGTTPSMRGVRNAISGGPTLVIGGKKQRLDKAEGEAYQYASMLEQHPRAAIGWNERDFFWALVDGRHEKSVGMTLSELAAFMVELGCVEAMNLDGGGSATMWFDGKVRNRPCDGYERPIANALVLTARERTAAK